jgi:hypothetical protein
LVSPLTRTDRYTATVPYGEWLRRERRRRDAHDQLGSAYEIFDSVGAAAFAERARIELRATGGHARPPLPTTCGKFSPSSASAPATSLLPRFPPGQAQHRGSRRRADSQADLRTAAAVPAWPAINTLSTTGPRLSIPADAHRRAPDLASMSCLNRLCGMAGVTLA